MNSTELATVTHGALALSDKIAYAKALAEASLLPENYRRQPANILLAMEYGDAIGLPNAAVAIQNIHVIEGKPAASAQLIAALVRRAGHRLRVSGDNQKARCEIIRYDDPEYPFIVEWTIDDAVAAGLVTLRNGKPYARDSKDRPKPWERFTPAMLKARAITQCARDACAEALNGVAYTPDELGADVDAQGRPVIEQVPVTTVASHERVTAEEIFGKPRATVVDAEPEPTPETDFAEAAPMYLTEAQGEQPVEVVELPVADPMDVFNPISGAQTKKLHATFGELGFDRDAGLAFCTSILGREVTTTKELSRDDASRVIEKLGEQ